MMGLMERVLKKVEVKDQNQAKKVIKMPHLKNDQSHVSFFIIIFKTETVFYKV